MSLYQQLSTDPHRAFEQAASSIGVDANLMKAIGKTESGFRAVKNAAGSSAAGILQFTNSTWRSYMNRFARQYGIPSNATQMDNRAMAILGAKIIQDEIATVKQNGRPVTPTDVYMVHFLGPGGYAKFASAMKKNPNAPVSTFMSSTAIRQNGAYTNRAGGGVNTVQEMYRIIGKKLASRGGISEQQAFGGSVPTVGQSTDASANNSTNTQQTTPESSAPQIDVNGLIDKLTPKITETIQSSINSSNQNSGGTNVDTTADVSKGMDANSLFGGNPFSVNGSGSTPLVMSPMGVVAPSNGIESQMFSNIINQGDPNTEKSMVVAAQGISDAFTKLNAGNIIQANPLSGALSQLFKAVEV